MKALMEGGKVIFIIRGFDHHTLYQIWTMTRTTLKRFEDLDPEKRSLRDRGSVPKQPLFGQMQELAPAQATA